MACVTYPHCLNSYYSLTIQTSFAQDMTCKSLVLHFANELKRLNDWFAVNLFSLNVAKTNYIVFSKTNNV